MESISITLDDASFDAAVHAQDALPEGGDMKVCVKRRATVGGNPAICITWTVQLPSGMQATCQAVTTAAAFLNAAEIIKRSLL